MAEIKPFRALRPVPELASKICELPYDVMSSAEARVMAEGNPQSFLHVSKPEIDLPEGTDVYDAAVYQKGRDNFKALIGSGALKRDEEPYFYLYRQVMGEHSQIGLVAAASCSEYLSNVIRKHEFTRPQKEDDRVRHIEALDAQTGPVFLTYKAVAALDAMFSEVTSAEPEIDFTAGDGVCHSAWLITDETRIAAIQKEFAALPALYIADGHHRSAAAGRVYESRKGAGQSSVFLTVLFPHNQMQILPYNRVLKDLNGLSVAELQERLATVFEVKEAGVASPQAKHEVACYLDGKWNLLSVRPEFRKAKDPVDELDVAILQQHVLAPMFGIDDPRTSERIQFVGGIRGTEELERLVDGGDFQCAFSMFPTSIEDLMDIADGGGVMPPKSTWFEPKLRDAMFCHLI